MVYWRGLEEHSTEFEFRATENEIKTLYLRDVIGMARVASNANKSLKIINEVNGEETQLIYLKKL